MEGYLVDAFLLADDIFENPDLLTVGDRLLAFFDSAKPKESWEKSLEYLYENVHRCIRPINCSGRSSNGAAEDPLEEEYGLLDGKRASEVLLAQQLLSIRSTPAMTLMAIEQLGNDLKKAYSEPFGNMLNRHEAMAVLEYLDSAFSIRDAIFTGGHAVLLLPYGHHQHNGECMVLHDPPTSKVAVKVLLYSCREGNDPRYVLCHELGHALHTMYCGKPKVQVPDEILYYLELYSPMIRTLDRELQNEILADLLAVGMMYGSPFSDADPFDSIDDEGKKFLHRLVRLICWKTAKGERIVPVISDDE